MASLHDGSETRYVVSVAHSAAEIKWLEKKGPGISIGSGSGNKGQE